MILVCEPNSRVDLNRSFRCEKLPFPFELQLMGLISKMCS